MQIQFSGHARYRTTAANDRQSARSCRGAHELCFAIYLPPGYTFERLRNLRSTTLLPSAPEGTPASSSLLMDLPAGIHGKRAVELTGIRPLLKPLHGCVKKGHVLVFPDQIMRRAGDVNKDLLGYRH